jgi:hypothetical protein
LVPRPSRDIGVGSSAEHRERFRPVAQDEDPLAVMRGADLGGAYACPCSVIPDFGQVAKYAVQSASTQGGDVLHDDDARS